MFVACKGSAKVLACVVSLTGMLVAPVRISAAGTERSSGRPVTVEAGFRGCDSAGWCPFMVEPWSMLRVRPDGVASACAGETASTAIRDRLNALLANMIPSSQAYVLRDLRELDDGTWGQR